MRESRKREIRIKAENFRGKCKVGRYGILDLFKECERCGYKLIRYPLEKVQTRDFQWRKMAIRSFSQIPAMFFVKKILRLLMKSGM